MVKIHLLSHFQYEGGTQKQIFTKYHSCKWGTNIQHIPILFTCSPDSLDFRFFLCWLYSMSFVRLGRNFYCILCASWVVNNPHSKTHMWKLHVSKFILCRRCEFSVFGGFHSKILQYFVSYWLYQVIFFFGFLFLGWILAKVSIIESEYFFLTCSLELAYNCNHCGVGNRIDVDSKTHKCCVHADLVLEVT